MSESRYSSESRSSESRSDYGCSYPSSESRGYSSESRSSESRSSYSFGNRSSKSSLLGYTNEGTRVNQPKNVRIKENSFTKYNNLDSIDELIEKLEKKNINVKYESEYTKEAINERNRKIKELKDLKMQAEILMEEELEAEKINEDNEELDLALDYIKKLVNQKRDKLDNSSESR